VLNASFAPFTEKNRSIVQRFQQRIRECRQNHSLNQPVRQFPAAAVRQYDFLVVGNRQRA
jgi:hypothetical protein